MKLYTLTVMIVLFLTQVSFADAKYTPSKDFDTMNAEDQKEFDRTVDELIDHVCQFDARLKRANDTIDREKEINKITGTVNVDRLHAAGSEIVYSKANRTQLVNTYKKVMGKDLTNYECQ